MRSQDNNADFRGIWERQNDETDLQYNRFRQYLAMKDRNITELARIFGIRDSGLRVVAGKRKWSERAAAYDRWVSVEMERRARDGALLSIDSDQQANDQWLAEYENMRAELWAIRAELLKKVKKMLTFEVGNSTKTARKVYRAKNPQTKQMELNVIAETVTDARWSWGDVARMSAVIDQLGQEILNLTPDIIRELPAFCYELRRHNTDPADFMRRTVAKLKVM